MAPSGSVYQAGTLSGNPTAVAVGRATLEELRKPGVHERLEILGDRLEEGLIRAAKDAGIAATINRVGSMMTAFFAVGSVTDFASTARSDVKRYAVFFH